MSDQNRAINHPTAATAELGPELLSRSGGIMNAMGADVGRTRESSRRRRLWTISAWLGVPSAFLWYRQLDGRPFNIFALPHVDWAIAVPILFFVALGVGLVLTQVWAGRSPHVIYRPEQIDTRMDDVVGIDVIKEEVVRSLNLFLAHKTYAQTMGGTPRRGILFEGSPGTGKTHMAKAMAAEAGVPFLFVSATAFQSMFYGATAKKIRSYFKELRAVARREGGAIGFIEEIDAIATARAGLSMTEAPHMRMVTNRAGAMSESAGGVVNELLVQLQSFDTPTGSDKLANYFIDKVNLLLPAHRQLHKRSTVPANVMIIAATNRADSLDPALLRPGRFDRRLTFELPAKNGRRQLIDHFLTRKAHTPELDSDERRDALAAVTQGYSPVMIEHLMDEALVTALRHGKTAMSWEDVEKARLTEEVGLGQPVAYTEHEARLIATHEAGHATVAWLAAPGRRLEVLSMIKRREALGMLAHGDREDVYTRSRTELIALMQIAMGGQAAEEIFFGDISTGPAGDLAYATNIAAEMVGSAGMAGSLMSFAAVQNSAFSDTNIVGRVLGDPEGRHRVEALLVEQKAAAVRMISENRHLVEALRDALLERQELIGDEIGAVLRAATAAHKPAEPKRRGGKVIDLRDGVSDRT